MKKSLLALAVLGAFAGVASAQSSVTLFGVVDQSVNSVKNGKTTVKSLDSNQLNSNRLGFRGVEDLGGGLTASFWLEGGLGTDTGSAGSATAGQFFNRRSTLSLSGGFGEIRLGRDYVNTFSTVASTDVYGANGFGNGSNLYASGKALFGLAATGGSTSVRANNVVGYFLPANLGGLYGSLQVAAPEGTPGNGYKGGRIGYAAGPLDVSASLSQTDWFTGKKYKVTNFGGSFDLGVAKLYGFYDQRKYGALKYTTYEFSASVPLGQSEFRASYAKGNSAGAGINADDATLFSVEYIYNLSKRTALYTQYGRLTNKGASNLTVGLGTGVAGGNSTGYGAGVRHSF